jgi:hypothetical protein
MANTIILKRSSTPGKVPTTAQLALGEIGINTYDGLIYIKKDDGATSVVQIGGVTSVNTKTGSVVLSTTDVAEGTAQYFTNARARSAISAGTGISYNSTTGAISTAQNLSTTGTPAFAGMTLTGGISSIAGSIVPSADVTYDLGSPAKQWKDIYVGPGSLYVNGQKVLQDDSGTITFSADLDENIRIKTLGTGILQLGSSTSVINVDSTLQIAAGKNITDSAGIKVNFGDNIEMNGNKVIGLGAPSSANDAATKTYVDTAIGNISTSTLTQGNSNIQVVDSGTGTVTVTVDGSTALTVDANGVVVAGNFTVSGTTTSVNSNTINLADNIITLNSDATGAPTQNAGVEVKRGDEANVQLRWNEGTDKWTFTNDGAVYYPVAVGTDDLAEGATNQYFTNARARNALSITSSTGISYNSGTGVFALGSIPNSSLSNNSISINGTSVALGGSRTLDTDAVNEGVTNKYFSNTLARGAVSASTGLSYNSSTGVFTIDSTVATLTGAQTLTNKTLTSPTINGATIGGSLIPAVDVTYDLGDATHRFRDLFLSGSTIRLGSAVLSAVGTGLSLGGSAVVTVSDTGTVTNTMLAGSIANAKLANSAVTVTAGTGLSGGGSVSLGGTVTLTNTITQYTDALARGAVSFTAGSGAYNSTTGVITIPTNNNQLTNGAGYITGFTETDTLASVTARGASTTAALSTGALTVTGSITASGEITAYFSDERLKQDIAPITGALDKVMAIGGYTYKANDLAHELGVSRYDNQIGLLAGEVEAVMPELVTQSALAGYKTIRYDKVVSVLVEAIKEQQAMIEELRKDVKKTLH